MKIKLDVKGVIAIVGGFVLAGFVFFLISNTLGRMRIGLLIDLPTFIIVAGLGSAYALLYCGRKLSVQRFLKAFKTGVLYAGGLSCAAALIIMFNSMAENPEALGHPICISLLSLIYGFALSAIARIVERYVGNN